jgi:hypothetical protein
MLSGSGLLLQAVCPWCCLSPWRHCQARLWAVDSVCVCVMHPAESQRHKLTAEHIQSAAHKHPQRDQDSSYVNNCAVHAQRDHQHRHACASQATTDSIRQFCGPLGMLCRTGGCAKTRMLGQLHPVSHVQGGQSDWDNTTAQTVQNITQLKQSTPPSVTQLKEAASGATARPH